MITSRHEEILLEGEKEGEEEEGGGKQSNSTIFPSNLGHIM